MGVRKRAKKSGGKKDPRNASHRRGGEAKDGGGTLPSETDSNGRPPKEGTPDPGPTDEPGLQHRPPWLMSACVFVFLLFVYMQTAFRSVPGGDTGELLVAACNGGVAHPPGYPTFTILAALSRRVGALIAPATTVAFRVAVLSAACGALAGVFIFLTVCLLTSNPWAAAFAALGFGLTPTVWLYSIQGEVFALNNCFVGAIAYLVTAFFFKLGALNRLRAWSSGNILAGFKKRYVESVTGKVIFAARAGAFVCGLALTNQHTTVFPVAVSALSVVGGLGSSGLLTSALVVELGLWGLAGMSPYLYLPYAAVQMPMDTWGDQRSLDGFLTHFLRREYGTFQLAASEIGGGPSFSERIFKFLEVALDETLAAPVWLAGAGLVAAAYSGTRTAWYLRAAGSLVAAFALYLGVFSYLSNLAFTPLFLGVQKRFWMQANLYVFIFAGVGLDAASRAAARFTTAPPPAPSSSTAAEARRQTQPTARGRATQGFSGVALLLMVHILIMRHLPINNHRQNRSVDVYGRKILESLPPGAVLLVNGDLNNNAPKYLQQCEGLRTDVDILGLQQMSWSWWVPMQRHHYPNISFPGNRYHVSTPGSFNMGRFLDANFDRRVARRSRRAIFLCGQWKAGDASAETSYELLPYGLCNRVVRRGSKPRKMHGFLKKSWDALPKMTDLGVWDPVKYTDDSWEHVAFFDTWHRTVYLSGLISFHASQRGDAEPALLDLGKIAFDYVFSPRVRRLLKANGIYRADDYRGAGIVYGRWAAGQTKGKARTKAEKRMVKLWKKYLELKPEDNELQQFIDAGVNPFSRESLGGA